MMMARAVMAGLMAATLLLMTAPSPVTSLASKDAFNRHIRTCLSDDPRPPLTFGMTMGSFIDRVDYIERKVFKKDASPSITALTLLHWFSLPDLRWRRPDNRFEQSDNYRYRYEFISRLFEEAVLDLPVLEEELSDEDRDTICFLIRVLSHSTNNTCYRSEAYSSGAVSRGGSSLSQSGNDESYRQSLQSQQQQQQQQQQQDTQRRAQSGSVATRQRARPPTWGSSSAGFSGGTPNLRDAQSPLQDRRGVPCGVEELGVVSVTGDPADAVSVMPVLVGIAAANEKLHDASLFPSSNARDERFGGRNQDNSRRLMDPLLMGTLGQEIGFSAFYKEVRAGESQKGFDTPSGRWNQTGCLVSFLLNVPAMARSVSSVTQAQIAGAMDGYILGNLVRDPSSGLNRFSLASLLRIYYSNTQTEVRQQTSGMQPARLSVCAQRKTRPWSMRTMELKEQSMLMAYGLALKDGVVFGSDRGTDGTLDFRDNGDISHAVDAAWSVLDTLDVTSKLEDNLCRRNQQDQDTCWSAPDVHVILDTSNAFYGQSQADLLGQIVNGLEFRQDRNSMRVYAGRSKSGLQDATDYMTSGTTGSSGITTSGTAACIAQNFARSNMVYGQDNPADVFNALNEMLRKEKQERSHNAMKLATPPKVVIYFNMGDEGIRDPDMTAEALIRLRLAHPELTIVGIGNHLDSVNDLSGAMHVFTLTDIRNPMALDKLRTIICEAPINLYSADCRLDGMGPQQGSSRGSSLRAFSSGVEPKRVQFVSYPTENFAASDDMRVKFTANSNEHIRVCDASSGYDYSGTSQRHQSPQRQPSQSVPSSADIGSKCQETNDNMRSVYFNYSTPCLYGPRSCAPLRYAVVGVERRSQGAGFRPSPPGSTCAEDFCISPTAAKYTVEPQGMRCSASGLVAAAHVLLVPLLIAAMFVHQAL